MSRNDLRGNAEENIPNIGMLLRDSFSLENPHAKLLTQHVVLIAPDVLPSERLKKVIVHIKIMNFEEKLKKYRQKEDKTLKSAEIRDVLDTIEEIKDMVQSKNAPIELLEEYYNMLEHFSKFNDDVYIPVYSETGEEIPENRVRQSLSSMRMQWDNLMLRYAEIRNPKSPVTLKDIEQLYDRFIAFDKENSDDPVYVARLKEDVKYFIKRLENNFLKI